ncbi:MAG TPA: trigger factor [Thermodesulfovibrionales bacterium]|nr:trigger factor [Thermodesulfovibrionales bacterium]
MLRAVEDITTTRKRLTIEISPDDIEREIRDAFEKLKRKTTLPGFRTGKAPMELIEKKFGREVEQDVLDRVIPRGYLDALKEANLVPVANPVMEEKLDFRRHHSLSMTLTVEVMPKIDNLQYEGIKVKDFPVKVDESDVESVLQRQQEEKATYEPSEGPVDMSDLVVIDYAARDEGIDAKDQVFKVGGSMFPGEFSQGLVGRRKGEEFSTEVTFPEEHPSSKLAGRKVALSVMVKDIKKVHLPQIDDELAKDSGFENLGEMKERIGEEIEKAKKNEVAKIQKAEILRKLIESHEFDVPESLVETETTVLASTVMASKGQEAEKDPETLKQELRPNAMRNVKASLLVETIGKAQGVSVSEEEIKGAIVSLSQRLSASPESIMKFYISRDGSLEGLKNAIFEDKVLDLILSKAVVEKGE